jgi:hypothetical protein
MAGNWGEELSELGRCGNRVEKEMDTRAIGVLRLRLFKKTAPIYAGHNLNTHSEALSYRHRQFVNEFELALAISA